MAIKLALVAGARPNFMKVAPILHSARVRDDVESFLIHTGQHYDDAMSKVFLDQLGIGSPDVNLGVGSGTHAQVTARVMSAIEPVLEEQRPDIVVVVGDVNSTLAAAIVAAKLQLPVAHVEAGLRSFDRSMPEEINRVMVDAISDFLFVSEPAGVENLRGEGVRDHRIHLVGNTMIDTLLAMRDAAAGSRILESLSLDPQSYAVLTLHRPGNVDDPKVLKETMARVRAAAERIPVVFPLHPRTRNALEKCGLARELETAPGMHPIPPASYLDFLHLIANARVVLTDSGGIQEETSVLGVPCLTLRDNTERPITLETGTNRLVGSGGTRLLGALEDVLNGSARNAPVSDLWDGKAGERIVDVLCAGDRKFPQG